LVVALQPPASAGGAWNEYELYAFGFDQGEVPLASVVSESGSLLGTTFYGGDEFYGEGGCGTAYELTPPATRGGAWTETTIHTFAGAAADGGRCIFANGSGCGTVFELTPPATPGGTMDGLRALQFYWD
jgi:hypothetical protein